MDKRWSELTPAERVLYNREKNAASRAKKRLANPARVVKDTPQAARQRNYAKEQYHKKKKQNEAEVLAAGREHQRLLRLKKDGGPVGRVVKKAIANVLAPYAKVDRDKARRLYLNDYRRNRYSSDDVYRFRCRLRVRLVTYMRTTGKSINKDTHQVDELVARSPDDLMSYLEQESSLSVSVSEIDHIFALALYDLSNPQNVTKVMHWSNLQLLTKAGNRWKTDKLPTKAMAAKVDRSCWPDGITMDMLPDIYPGWATPLRMHARSDAPLPGWVDSDADSEA
jgi:hypothetical protein